MLIRLTSLGRNWSNPVVDRAPYFNPGRQWGYALSMGFLVVIAGPVLLPYCCPSISPLQWSIQTAIITAYILYLLQRNLRLNTRQNDRRPQSSLGAANWITLSRGGLIAFLGGFLLQPWPGRSYDFGWAMWVPGIIYIIASVGDVFDGFVARITVNKTLLGELLDTQIDALGILVASLLAITYERLPDYYISAGLAYYLVRIAVWLRRKTGRPCSEVKRRRGAKLLAGVQMAFLGVVLLPLLSASVTKIAAVFFLIPFLAGFLVDWQMVCRHETSTPIN
jgi:CDP-diacylglycerol--glycerol-3-phosphate 3-phosphatidyltransferase